MDLTKESQAIVDMMRSPSHGPGHPGGASLPQDPARRKVSKMRPVVNWHKRHLENLTRGERAADQLRNGMGSWLFIGSFVTFMILWALINSSFSGWDPYPYILLNLFLSMLAGLQGAILLIAAKRQDGISAALAQHDYETNLSAKKELEELMEINRVQLELIREIHGYRSEGSR